jgi:dipeptidase E
MKQIIASGGGGFTRKNSTFALEKYILAQTNKAHPKICFLPQASNEDSGYIAKFLETFQMLGAQPTWVSLFGRVEDSWKDKILNADVVYVGGGNTKSMIALWKAWGVDTVLREAYEKGAVMAGVSAGMLCWFEHGITDSVWPLGVVEGLGFIKGSACPHFDSEVERQEVYKNLVNSGAVGTGIALEDHTAAHFIDGTLHTVITEVEGKKGFQLAPGGSKELRIEIIKSET